MPVIRTDRWLLAHIDQPLKLCKKLEKYFQHTPAKDIHHYLIKYGMYSKVDNNQREIIDHLQKKDIWDIVAKEKQILRNKWQGPRIPVFIFPADSTNYQLLKYHNGKAGLAFIDKLFLFISKNNTEKEIRALFTHEYNHVCRLVAHNKKEKDYTLLDTIILEGLAENAVREQFGESYLAKWTSFYSTEQLEKMWQRIILPEKNLSKSIPKHQAILYGFRFYPKMAGYCVGYYLVKKYLELTGLSSTDLLSKDTETVAQLKESECDADKK